MRAIAWLRRNPLEAAWAVFAAANWVAMVFWPSWETIPFHFVWISLTFVYGVRVWSTRTMWAVLSVVILATGVSISADAFNGIQLWGELFEVPLMSAMFLAMVWHARRRQAALAEVQGVAEMRASLLERQERFLHDASHELRTPVTIARGHLELLRRDHPDAPELEVALDELDRMERIVERLLILAKSEQQGIVFEEIELEAFLSDLFMRWSEVAPRAWRLDVDLAGRLRADPEGLRNALDALLENAVKYTDPGRCSRARGTRGRRGRGRDRGLGLGSRRPTRRPVADLRPLGPGRRCAHPRPGRRRPRPRDRRCGGAGARRPLLRQAADPWDRVPASPARAFPRHRRASPDAGR